MLTYIIAADVGIPWGSFTASAGGWTLVGFAVFCVFIGWLIPRWVVAMMEKRIDSQDRTIKELVKQNTALTEALKIANDTMAALKRAAEAQAGMDR